MVLIPLEAEAVGLPPVQGAIEFPNPDFAALARACRGHGFRATNPGELEAEINEALKADGPAIVDVTVAADEMPNIPHIAIETVGNYAMAKIKEAVLGVTGRNIRCSLLTRRGMRIWRHMPSTRIGWSSRQQMERLLGC